MEDFLSIPNFTYLIQQINRYSKDKYHENVDYNLFKSVIGKAMQEVYRNFQNKINKEKANKMVLYAIKHIVDKEFQNKFFENESQEHKFNDMKQLTQQPRPVVDEDIKVPEDLKIRPVFEQRYNKILENNQEINRQINNDCRILKR